jgi:hypothetical protein
MTVRPRAFDEKESPEAAMMVFRAKGYKATSFDDLVEYSIRSPWRGDMMHLSFIVLGVLLPAAICIFSVSGSAQARPPDDDKTPRVTARRLDSRLLVNVEETAAALGWEAKVVRPGKLLTLCRGGDDGVCIPIRLESVTFSATPEGLFVDAAIVERALQIRFKDDHSPLVVIEPVASEEVDRDEIPAYNADWGPGRGFRVGQTVPDIPLIDLDGREVRFSEFLGKRYIIYCWASW